MEFIQAYFPALRWHSGFYLAIATYEPHSFILKPLKYSGIM